jgi:mono/diheme cytochrome c family protein
MIMIRPPVIAFAMFFLASLPAGIRAADEDAERSFAVKVLPLLKTKCFACHGGDPDDVKGKFDIRSRAGMLKGGESEEAAIVPGKPEESPLVAAIKWEDSEMPPKENDRLNAEQIESIGHWIKAGAPWPDEATLAKYRKEAWGERVTKDGVLVDTSGGLSDVWTYRRYKPEDVWAFQPVKRPAVPKAAAHPIDAFIRAKINDAGLKPAKRADPKTLIRRVTYDLTGLPPTPEEVSAFERESVDDPKSAFRNLIDRLLESSYYGEHWGQHWLDVVRYADTSGFSNDWERSSAWRYRDYVIRSFNNDKPYNRFIIEQIAGDELKPGDPEMLIAIGYLRMGPWEHTPMNPNKVSRQEYLDDVVNSIGQTFLSTAMRCCKCHDHKFDPIPTRDYYRLYAALATTQPAERPAKFLEVEDKTGFAANRQHVEALLKFETDERNALLAKREAAAKKWYAERGREDEYVDFNQRRRLPGEDKPPRFIGLTKPEYGILKVREQNVRIWTRRLERFQPLALSVYSGGDLYQQSVKLRMPNPKKQWELANSKKMPETFINSGGNVFSPAGSVTPGVLSGLQLAAYSAREDDPYALPLKMERRRLALARWIAHPKNALTTRSIVNRIWHYHFGRGLAGNPNNFGATGKRPTHPELLDWLAAKFVEDGWSIKKIHRLIVTSQTYQQASRHADIEVLGEKDPNNDLLAVFDPRRLTAEELRDSMLAITGELNVKGGGLPTKPDINMEVALAPRMLQASLAPAWQPSPTPAERNRRSIYAYRVRGLADPLLEVFNKPGSDESCEMRDSPSVTPQVFSLMNSAVATNRSIAMAVQLQGEAKAPADQIASGYERAIGQAPNDAIREKLLQHYQKMIDYHRQHKPKPVTYPTRVTRSVVEEFSGDPIFYEERLDIYEDYVPDQQAADVSAETRALADVCLLLFNSNAFIYVY